MKKYIRYGGKLYRAVDELARDYREIVQKMQRKIEKCARNAREELTDDSYRLEYLIKQFKAEGDEKTLLESCEKSYKQVKAVLAALKGI